MKKDGKDGTVTGQNKQTNSLRGILENFEIKDDGILWYTTWHPTLAWSRKIKQELAICSFIEVVAAIIDIEGRNHGRMVEIIDSCGNPKKFPLTNTELSSPGIFRKKLLWEGMWVSNESGAINKLIHYLQTMPVYEDVLCVEKTGWCRDSDYILHFASPAYIIPENPNIHWECASNYDFGSDTDDEGSEGWQKNVAHYGHGNSMVITALCTAFAPPFLYITNGESFGINVKGKNSSGKTTLLHIAGSVWGNPSYVKSCGEILGSNTALASIHNHTLLCLDKLDHMSGREAGDLICASFNGDGKAGFSGYGKLQARDRQQIIVLSSGEVSITDKIVEAGKIMRDSIGSRMIDISADAGKGCGVYENLHGFDDVDSFSRHFLEATQHDYGTPAIEAIQKIIEKQDKIPAMVNKIREDFINQNVEKDADCQICRVASYFALILAAGQFVAKEGILPFTNEEITEAVTKCFKAWLDKRALADEIGENLSRNPEVIIRRVRAFLTENYGRFVLWDKKIKSPLPWIRNQAGFRLEVSSTVIKYYIFPEAFGAEVLKGLHRDTACEVLVNHKMLTRSSDNKFSKKYRIPGSSKPKRLYCITLKASENDAIASSDNGKKVAGTPSETSDKKPAVDADTAKEDKPHVEAALADKPSNPPANNDHRVAAGSSELSGGKPAENVAIIKKDEAYPKAFFDKKAFIDNLKRRIEAKQKSASAESANTSANYDNAGASPSGLSEEKPVADSGAAQKDKPQGEALFAEIDKGIAEKRAELDL